LSKAFVGRAPTSMKAPKKEEVFTQSSEQTPLEVNDENLLSFYTTKIKIS